MSWQYDYPLYSAPVAYQPTTAYPSTAIPRSIPPYAYDPAYAAPVSHSYPAYDYAPGPVLPDYDYEYAPAPVVVPSSRSAPVHRVPSPTVQGASPVYVDRNGSLSAAALRSHDPTHGAPVNYGDRASTGSKRSSVGSTFRSVPRDGPYSRLQRLRTSNKPLGPEVVPKPNGTKLALLIAINPERSKASSSSARHMYNLLRRHNYTVEEIIYTGDEEQFEADIESAVTNLIESAVAGDSIIVHAIGYGLFAGQEIATHINPLVNHLPKGVRLTCILDSCYSKLQPAYEINHRAPLPPRKDARRLATSQATTSRPEVGVNPSVFMFIGNNKDEMITRFDSLDGQACVFTSSFILALNKKDVGGFWSEPPTYAQMQKAMEDNLAQINKSLPSRYKFNMPVGVYCTGAFDIDQPAWI